MAIVQAMCSSYKQELFGGIHDMENDELRMALYTSAATLDASTTIYTPADEVVGAGYTARGLPLQNVTISLSGTTAFIDFDNVTWTSATFTARGALIFNATKADRAIGVYDFGEDRTSTAGNFTVEVPAPNASNAVIRIV